MMEVSSLCRGCLKNVASWERENFDPRCVEMFSFCTNIRITEDDKLPQQFCYDCATKIESSYTFITEAQKVHVTLKNIISRCDTSIIIQPDSFKKPTHNSEMKLTLPDYKICSVIDTRPVPDAHTTEIVENFDDSVEPLIEMDEYNEENTKEINSIEPNTKELKSSVIESTSENVCPVCRKRFTSKTWFTKHMQKDHTGKKYGCAHCPRSFSRPSQLSYHSVSHSEERKFVCSACGKRFKRRKQLTVHTKAHADSRPHACDQCPARFKTKSILKSHMSVHEKDKSFLCSLCGWSFAQAGNLTVHMRMHTGDKPYACALCPFRASAASNLRRHERSHARQRLHACAHCGRTFIDRSNLTRHIRIHTGALPYKCPACPSAFSDSWKRKAHLMRTHKIPLQDIPRMRTDGRLIQY